jgi:hypothetical protein
VQNSNTPMNASCKVIGCHAEVQMSQVETLVFQMVVAVRRVEAPRSRTINQ